MTVTSVRQVLSEDSLQIIKEYKPGKGNDTEACNQGIPCPGKLYSIFNTYCLQQFNFSLYLPESR